MTLATGSNPPRLLSPSPARRKRRRHFEDWHADWTGRPLGTLVLALLLIAAPQLLGGLLPWTINAIAILSLLSLAVVGARAPALERRFPRLGIVLLVTAGWTALQAAPLPCWLVEWIAPDSAAKQHSLSALIQLPHASTCTISQDPGNTQQEIIKSLCLCATFIAAWAFAASGGSRRLFYWVAGSSLAISVVALSHALFGWDRVFDWYAPVGIARVWLLSPLMNSNNLGGFAALGPPLWIGLSYREPNPNVRLLGYVAIALTSITALLSLSRGAIGQLLAGYVVMAWLILRRRRQAARPARTQSPTREIGMVLAGAAGLGLGAYLVGNEALQEFSSGKLDKLDLSLAALRYAAQHALAGVGRGAFGSAFVSAEGAVVRYRYAEDFVAHWAAEWGIPMTLTLLCAIGFELFTSARPRDSLARAGAVTALCLFAGQNLVDFGFELLGIATVAVALLAACVAPSPDATSKLGREPNPLRRGSNVALATMVAGVVATATLGPRLHQQSVPALTQRLRRLSTDSQRAAFRQAAAQAVQLHPSEPVLTMLIASEALAHHDPKAAAWLNRSMQLAPHWARPHQLAFRWLWQRGQGQQALHELKLAAAIDVNVVLEDVCRLGRVHAQWALAVAPENRLRRSFMERVSYCISSSPAGREFDLAVLREYPDSLFPLMHQAERLRQSGKIDEALTLLERASHAYPEDYRPNVQRFQILLSARRLQELLDGIDAAIAQYDAAGRAELLSVKAFALAYAGSPDLAFQAIEQVRRLGGTDPEKLAASFNLEARLHMELHEPGAAFTAYRQAYRIKEDTATLLHIADLAESLGDRAQALWAYVHLCEREPNGGGCERRNALLSPSQDNSIR